MKQSWLELPAADLDETQRLEIELAVEVVEVVDGWMIWLAVEVRLVLLADEMAELLSVAAILKICHDVCDGVVVVGSVLVVVRCFEIYVVWVVWDFLLS